MSTVAMVVQKGEEPALTLLLPTLKSVELELGLPLEVLLVSDGPLRADLEAILQDALLAGHVFEPPAWGETIGLEASEARLVLQAEEGDCLLISLSDNPGQSSILEALKRLQGESLVPRDWDLSHQALPPRISGFSLGLVHCSACKTLLRSERGSAIGAKPKMPCAGRPG